MIVELTIKTWCGVHAGAQHYYGVLRGSGQRPTRLEYTLDAEEAKWMNNYDNTPGMYKAGSTSERFRSADRVRARAQEVWVELYPDATELEEKS